MRFARCARPSRCATAMAELNRELERDLGVGLELRIGVNTGEVVAGDRRRPSTFVSGDAVNIAARLEQAAAPPGGIAHRRRRRAGSSRARSRRAAGAARAKGKRRPVARVAGRAVVATAVRFARRLGRRRSSAGAAELRRLTHPFDARSTRAPVRARDGLGAGRDRQVAPRAASSSPASRRRRPVVRRPLPALRRGHHLLAAGRDRRAPRRRADRGAARSRLLARRRPRPRCRRRVSPLRRPARAGAVAPRTHWAVRSLFEALARRRPLVVAFDDIHWAEPALLDLIEHLAANARAPVLIVCLARGDLLERRPGWAAAGGRGSVVRLEPLSDTDSARLLRRLAVRRRAAVRRDGAWPPRRGTRSSSSSSSRCVPRPGGADAAHDPGVARGAHRRLPARAAGDRGCVDRGAWLSPRGGARARRPKPRASMQRSPRSVERELIRRAVRAPRRDGYRFTHILVRDAAYDLLPKRRRADLHGGYADWLAARDDPGSAADEIVGYHLEQAYEYRSQLGRVGDDRHGELAARASGHLSAPGDGRSQRVIAAAPPTCSSGRSRFAPRPTRVARRSSSTWAASTVSRAGSARRSRRFARRARLPSTRATGARGAGPGGAPAVAPPGRARCRREAHAPSGGGAGASPRSGRRPRRGWRSSGTSAP